MRSCTAMSDVLFLRFTTRLDALGIRYMVTGSVAATLYGEPRMTHDVDLVVELSSDSDADALVAAFPEDEFYCAPAEIVRVEARRPQRGHFNIIDFESGFKADVYLSGRDEFHAWALQRRRTVIVDDSSVYLAPAEYVIVRKLTYYREGRSEKHLRDIEAMLAVSPDKIDREELQRWIDRFGLSTEWTLIGS